MKTFLLTLLLTVFFFISYGQTYVPTDSNPKLNKQEIAYFNSLFPNNNFDWNDKVIGFAFPNIIKFLGFIGVPKFAYSFLPMSKKEYFSMVSQDVKKKHASKLILLPNADPTGNSEFDAVVVCYPRKKEKKFDEAIPVITKEFALRRSNYPDNLQQVPAPGEQLQEQDIKFFERIYQFQTTPFDFRGRKIAFMNPNEPDDLTIKTKADYINKLKKQLEDNYAARPEWIVVLNEEQKTASGGYDAIIVYQTKMYHLNDLIKLLSERQER